MIFDSDSSHKLSVFNHKLNWICLGLPPLALILSPSALNLPIDLAMGVLIPIHAHISGNGVITDYAHKITKARWWDRSLRGMLATSTLLTIAGLLIVNIQGPGLTETVKSLWRPKPYPSKLADKDSI